jgi:hypothetical protein
MQGETADHRIDRIRLIRLSEGSERSNWEKKMLPGDQLSPCSAEGAIVAFRRVDV